MSLSDIQKSILPAKVLAVSKLQPLDKVRELFQQGQRQFGENYVQEALEKIEMLSDLSDIEWHFIGHLQKNKIKYILGKFCLIHSVDSGSLLENINKQCASKNLIQNVLLQINIANEDSKGGFNENDLQKQWVELTSLKNIRICGFMTMPPLTENPELVRPYFRRLKELQTLLKQKTDLNIHPLNQLSMGTSGDYKVAVEEGATIIRLGTILFGERPRKG
jgi:pyridoxal phosphate enzyme (YggS family)